MILNAQPLRQCVVSAEVAVAAVLAKAGRVAGEEPAVASTVESRQTLLIRQLEGKK
jgi:hypothetical protein